MSHKIILKREIFIPQPFDFVKEEFITQLLESINFVNLPEAAILPILKFTQQLDKFIEHDFNV